MEFFNIKHILKGHSGSVDSVVALADGKRLLTGATQNDGSIKLWDIKTGTCLKTIKTDQTIMTAAIVNASGTRAVIGGHEGKLTHLDVDTSKRLANLKGHSAGVVYSVQVTADQKFAVSGAEDNTIKIWSLATAREALKADFFRTRRLATGNKSFY